MASKSALDGVLEKYKKYPTNSAEWLIQESERKKKRQNEKSEKKTTQTTHVLGS